MNEVEAEVALDVMSKWVRSLSPSFYNLLKQSHLSLNATLP